MFPSADTLVPVTRVLLNRHVEVSDDNRLSICLALNKYMSHQNKCTPESCNQSWPNVLHFDPQLCNFVTYGYLGTYSLAQKTSA